MLFCVLSLIQYLCQLVDAKAPEVAVNYFMAFRMLACFLL